MGVGAVAAGNHPGPTPRKAEVGFEPTNNGFAIRPPQSGTKEQAETYEHTPDGLGALLDALQESPGLAAVVTAWPTLPEPMRAAILAVVEAAAKDNAR